MRTLATVATKLK